MSLFTFILEYNGGTYVAQVTAPSWRHAPAVWASQLDQDVVIELGSEGHAALRNDVAAKVPAPLEGLSGVWCVTALVNGKMALITFVRTADQEMEQPSA